MVWFAMTVAPVVLMVIGPAFAALTLVRVVTLVVALSNVAIVWLPVLGITI